jgi:hypothetical protein
VSSWSSLAVVVALAATVGGPLARAVAAAPAVARADGASADRSTVVTGAVGVRRCTFVDPTRDVLDFRTDPPTVLSHSRTLVTEIRYPTTSPGATGAELADAPVATSPTGYPMIVFAHGYDVTPDTYAPLLDAWARAGFVVVAPFFPDENRGEVEAQGTNTEGDLDNEPADLAFVARAVLSASKTKSPSCPLPAGLIRPNAIGFAGQSDGGTAVGTFSFATGHDPQGLSYAALRSEVHVEATVVMSGSEDGVDGYAAPPGGADLLEIQSAKDQCNPARAALELYRAIDEPNKFFLKLLTAHHLPPFDGQDPSAFALVVSVTTRYFRIALRGAPLGRGFLAFGSTQLTVGTISEGGSGPSMAGAPTTTTYCGLE